LELKAYKPIQPIELLKPRIMKNGCEYYLAGEVRMCIEQAARQIAESNSVYKELDTIIKHQKYKRCLAMAELCRLEQERIELIENQDITDDDFNKLAKGFYNKWRKSWLKIAEKLKEKAK